MGERTPAGIPVDTEAHERHRKTYQVLLVIAICLAVIGSPMLMEGAVSLVNGITQGSVDPEAVVVGVGRFAVGAAPMVLAAYTWGKVRGLERVLEEEELRGRSAID